MYYSTIIFHHHFDQNRKSVCVSFLPIFYFVYSSFKRLVRLLISIFSVRKNGLNRWFASAADVLLPSYSTLKKLISM